MITTIKTLRQCALVTKELASAATDSGCVEGLPFSCQILPTRGSRAHATSLVVRPPWGELHSGKHGAVTNRGTIRLSDERDSVRLRETRGDS